MVDDEYIARPYQNLPFWVSICCKERIYSTGVGGWFSPIETHPFDLQR